MLRFECAGCGAELQACGAPEPPFACPGAGRGDDVDHVVRRADPPRAAFPTGGDANPFVRYRGLLAAHALALECGVGDEAFVELVRGLDSAVAGVDGQGFEVTPFAPSAALAASLGFAGGEVWVKDETGNVSGSHKARHLVGLMLYLLVHGRRAGGPAAAGRELGHASGRRLAIASCGNAALAAAVVARASGWPLDVFVPPSAAASVLDRLGRLSAAIHTCRRAEGVAGDPCYLAFRSAVSGGAVPFCCQGSDNGLTIDGGKTLAWEMASAIAPVAGPAAGRGRIDAVFVQVGGGALASSIVQGFGDAVACGAIDRMPRVHTVQTEGGHPLERAYDTLAGRILARVAADGGRGAVPSSARARAEAIAAWPGIVTDEMAYARRHRSAFMRPWPTEPRSIAHGILDDETYDWAAVVEGMLRTGGWPLVVGEASLVEANALARRATGIDVDHTGSAGLAGLMQAAALDARLAAERVAVIFSGVRREA